MTGEQTCHPACRCYSRGGGYKVVQGVRRNDSGSSQKRGKFMKWFEKTCGGLWCPSYLNSVSGTLYPDPGQVTSLNFSFLIDKMGVMSFLIGLHDAKKRSSTPWWFSDTTLYSRLLCLLKSRLGYSGTYLISPLNRGISNLTCPTPDSESFPLNSLPPMVFPKCVNGTSTRVR